MPLSRRPLARLCWLTLAALAPLAPTTAYADGATTANALIEHGIQLREQGHDDQALVEFRKAYAASPSPRARAQMALAEQALGNWVLADQHLREALAADGDPWISTRKGVLTSAAAAIARHLGSLEVIGVSHGGARVLLDGVDVGAFPLTKAVRVETGSRLLEVRAPGFYPVVRTLEITAGMTARETVSLVVSGHGAAAGGSGDTDTVPSAPADEGTHVPGAYHAAFSPGGPSVGQWTLRDAADKPLCRLPCAYWVDPNKAYSLVRAPFIKGDADVRLPLPRTQMADGTEVRVQVRGPTGSRAGGVALIAGGVVLTVVGIVLLASAPSTPSTTQLETDPNAANDTVSSATDEEFGILAIVGGAFMTAGGIAVTVVSSGWAIDMKIVAPTPAVSLDWSLKGVALSKGTTRAWLTPFGVHGEF